MAHSRLEEGVRLNAIYELTERLSEGLTGEVWKAEDTLRGRTVSLKILGGEVPVDRDGLAQLARERIGLRHNGIAQIFDVVTEGPVWFVVREFAEGVDLRRVLDGRPLDGTKSFHFAVQIARALGYGHKKNTFHGNLSTDSVVVNARSGQLKIVGWGLVKGARSKEQTIGSERLSHLSVREVYCISPEQIRGEGPDQRSDVFSFGVVLYEMLTGRSAFPGTTSLEVMNAILQSQPSSPAVFNPSVSPGLTAIVGKCLQKDPSKRYPNAEEIWLALRKEAGLQHLQDPQIQALLGDEAEQSRRAAILVADILGLEEIEKSDPERAARLAGLMQELLWRRVHELNGSVIDPFSTKLVAEFPDVERALTAAQKAKGDIDHHNRENANDLLPVSMVVHLGTLIEREGIISGSALSLAYGVLPSVPSSQVFLSEEVVVEASMSRPLRPSMIFSGNKFYQFLIHEDPPTRSAPAPPPSLPSSSLAKARSSATKRVATSKRSLMIGGAIAIPFVVLALVGGFFLAKDDRAGSSPSGKAFAGQPLLVSPLSSGSNLDPNASSAWLATEEMLRSVPNLILADHRSADAVELAGTIRDDANGPEIAPTLQRGTERIEGSPISAEDSGLASLALLNWVLQEMNLPLPTFAQAKPMAVRDFASALRAQREGDEGLRRARQLVQASLSADPSFVPAVLLEAEIAAKSGDREAAVDAAEKGLVLAQGNEKIARRLAVWHRQYGSPGGAARAYAVVLASNQRDEEALAGMARLALAAGDESSYARLLARLKGTADAHGLFAPDIDMVQGRIEIAARRYQQLQASGVTDARLSYRVGRVAALRGSLDVARAEVMNLQKQGDGFEPTMLRALIAGQERRSKEAEMLLEQALAKATWSDEPNTRASEMYAILGNQEKMSSFLEKAVENNEPSCSYIVNSSLFRYPGSQPRLEDIRRRCAMQQNDIRAELARLP